MYNGFTKGLVVGGLIGASVIMMKPDLMNNRTKKRMMRNGRTFFRKSGSIIGDVVELFR
jgi:hypothetical protein